MLQAIRRNFALKLLSLALAIIGWAYFRFANNPVLAGRFDQQLSVPIVAADVPVGYVARFADKEAVVTVIPQRGGAPVKPDEIKAVLDLSKVDVGTDTSQVVNLPITLVAGPNVTVQSLSPATEDVTLEKIDQRLLPLAVHYVGAAQSRVVVGAVQLTPSSALVRGPANDLARVAALRVDVPLPAQSGELDEMVRPAAVDSLGAEIAGLTVSPDLIRVRARFSPATGVQQNP